MSGHMPGNMMNHMMAHMRVARWAGLGLAITLCAGRPGAAPVPAPPLALEAEGTYAYRLPNGLQVLLVPDPSKPTLTIHLTVRAGSRQECRGERGMAHLLEHLMFRPLPGYPAPRAQFAGKGIRANATTTYDRTTFFAGLAADPATAAWYLDWLAHALAGAPPGRAALAAELPAVRNEMDIGEGNGGAVLQQRALSAMYAWHAYGAAPIGLRGDVDHVDLAALARFRTRTYRPDNAVLVVAGAFDPDALLRTIAARFGQLRNPAHAPAPAATHAATDAATDGASAATTRAQTVEPVQDGEHRVTVRRPGGTPLVLVGFHAPAGPAPDFAALRLLVYMTTREPDGWLYRRLVAGGSAARVVGIARGQAEPGAFFFGVQPRAGQEIDSAVTALLAALTAPFEFGADDLERARAAWLAEWQRGYADAERIGAELSDAVGRGDWRLYFLERDQVRAVTLDDVRRVAAAWIRDDNRTVATFVPTDAPLRAPAPMLDLPALLAGFRPGHAGAGAAAVAITPAGLDAATERATLANGTQLMLLRKPTRGHLVEARLTMTLADADGLAGQTQVAGLLAAVLRKGGLTTLDRTAFEAELDRLQATLNIGFFRQDLIVDLRAPGAQLPAMVALVGRLLAEPALPDQVVEEERARWLANLERAGRDPAVRLDELVARHDTPYVPGDVRYVATIEEEAAAIRQVTPTQIRDFQRRFVATGAVRFAAVGDVDAQATRAALEAAFGAAPTRRDAAARSADRAAQPAPAQLVWRTPALKNATVVLSLPLPLRDDAADAPALRLADRMFGQVGAGRVWRRLREHDGVTYGAWSETAWNTYDPVSWWKTTATFAPRDRGRVESMLRDELARSLRDGFTAAELAAAKQGLLNERRLALAQDRVLARKLLEAAATGRGLAAEAATDRALAAVSVAQANAAWRKYVDPSRLVWAWAGDF